MKAVINLRQARKQKARAEKDAVSAQNRVLHGRSKGEKLRDRLSAESACTLHDGNFREGRPGGDGE